MTDKERRQRTRSGWAWLGAFTLAAVRVSLAAGAERPIESVLEEYIAESLRANLSLQRQDLSMEQSLRARDEARGRFLPQVSLEARATRADGGRTISFPVGDLLNPAYATLNELLVAQGRPPAFAAVENQEIRFLREEELQTYLRLTQPLYVPEISAALKARTALATAESAERESLARLLVRDVRTAYYGWSRAQQALAVVEASHALLKENLRVNERLHAAGSITRDQVLRAEAELLTVEQQRVEASKALDVSRSAFNFLLNRPLDTAIEAGELAEDLDSAPATLATLQRRALEQRAELRQLAATEEAAQAEIAGARARFKPAIAFAIESGAQGDEYGFDGEEDYTIASLNFTWNLFNGNQDRSRVAQARLQARSLALLQEETARQIELEVEQAHANLVAAVSALGAAEARQTAAREGFKIASRRRDAGAISQVEFLDARTTLTSAELNFTLTQFAALNRRAELTYALGEPAGLLSPEISP